MPTDNLRIGVFVCDCGSNIAGAVDTESVRRYAETLPNVLNSRQWVSPLTSTSSPFNVNVLFATIRLGTVGKPLDNLEIKLAEDGELLVVLIWQGTEEKNRMYLADLTAEEVIGFCDGRLARYKWPRRVFFSKEFPLTALGKVRKRVLKQEYIEKENLPPGR